MTNATRQVLAATANYLRRAAGQIRRDDAAVIAAILAESEIQRQREQDRADALAAAPAMVAATRLEMSCVLMERHLAGDTFATQALRMMSAA